MADNITTSDSTFKVSYYFTYKEWSRQVGLQYWPGYVAIALVGLFSVLVRPSDWVIISLLLTGLSVLLFCAFVTRFYANATLHITEKGLMINKKGKEKHFNWADMAELVLIVPSHGASYREVVIAIKSHSGKPDYIIIESLYFEWANSKAEKIGRLIETYFKGYQFKIHQSAFYAPVWLKHKDIFPIV